MKHLVSFGTIMWGLYQGMLGRPTIGSAPAEGFLGFDQYNGFLSVIEEHLWAFTLISQTHWPKAGLQAWPTNETLQTYWILQLSLITWSYPVSIKTNKYKSKPS